MYHNKPLKVRSLDTLSVGASFVLYRKGIGFTLKIFNVIDVYPLLIKCLDISKKIDVYLPNNIKIIQLT